ncbi:MAG: glutamate racemase [Bacteroidetes bacterium]|jgi:glutamate racemase|nr:glutamate racemase [Bacteroidota bacterium]
MSPPLLPGPIGVFDSGYGGLTVCRELEQTLPNYDFVYLGDNARVPYGNRSFSTVYRFTRQCVEALFDMGCHLVILACNTASAKALRSIQQLDLPMGPSHRRVLGVLRPSTEQAGSLTRSGHLGLFATEGTVRSLSYPLEIARFFPGVQLSQQACPLWVPLVEAGELQGDGTHYFVEKYCQALMEQDPMIDAVLLACTHYPLLAPSIAQHLPEGTRVVTQGPLIAEALARYLHRHPHMDMICSKNGHRAYFTTDEPSVFDEKATLFMGRPVRSQGLSLG